uniref:MFS domain-containing protein n=1 Tax=Meloidogyne hapla TaxID=6305 RepID=A0A1I8C3B9_MELHA
MWHFDKNQRAIGVLCLIYGIWHFGTNWTTTLISFLQWDTTESLSIVDLAYIQAFGSLCNAVGSLAIGQILRVGYQLDSTAEMYLATVTTERERTGALMILSIPQAISMFFAPISKGIHHCKSLREGLILRALLIIAYVCYELIARNFVLRSYMHLTSENAEVMVTMGGSLVITQFLILPFLQRHVSPRTLLQLACIALFFAYGGIIFTSSFYEYLLVTAIHTGAYAIAYAESSTQITGAVQVGDLGKATGLASMVQWTSHFLIPLYTSHIVNSWHYTYAFYSSSLLALITLGYITVYTKQTNARCRTLLPQLITT